MKKILKVGTIFSGIGAFEFALKRMGIKHEILFACDNGDRTINYDKHEEMSIVRGLDTPIKKKEYVDKLYSAKTRHHNFVEDSYLANFKIKDNMFFQDVRLFDGLDYKGKIDIFVGGSPCQSFSSVGYQGGFEDARGTLFYEYARLINEIEPKVFIYENVRNLINHDGGKTWAIMQNIFRSLGYKYYFKVLDAEDYGIPQIRRRVFVVGFKENLSFSFPKSQKLRFVMQDFLIESNCFGSFKNLNGKIFLENRPGIIDNKYFLSPKLYAYVMKGGTKSFYQKPIIDKEIARTILSTCGNRHRAGIDNYVTVNNKVRMLSEREVHRLMGFTDDYKIVVSRAQAYKQGGNSIVVDVLINLINEIIKSDAFK